MGLGPYRALLAASGVRRVVLWAFLGRVPIGMIGLALVLLVERRTGSYGIAGIVSAAHALLAGAGAPVHGRLMDRLGQTRVLALSATLSALTLAALVPLVRAGAPAGMLVAVAAVSGACFPQLSPAIRALWPGLAGAEGLGTAFALEAVTIELMFILGPLLTAVVSAVTSPGVALLVAAAMLLVGALMFALSAPSRTWQPAGREPARGGALSSRALRALLCVTLPHGLLFGVLEVALPAFGDREGAAEIGGVLLSVLAGGSLAGGLWYGTRTHVRPVERRLGLLSVALAVMLAPLALAPGVLAMAALCAVAGVVIAPLTAVVYALVEQVAPAGRVTESNTWLISAQVLGFALGSAAAGPLVQEVSVEAALALGSAGAVVAAGIALAARGALTSAAHG